MALSEIVKVLRRAAADAALADSVHRDPAFRGGLRSDPDATLRVFTVTSLSSGGQHPRELRRTWQLRLDPARTRPVL